MTEHMAASGAIIPISRFNKGEASKIFSEVQNSGSKVVFKNNRPVCVLLAPEKYAKLLEAIEKCLSFAEAEMRQASRAEMVPHEALLFSIREELVRTDVQL